MGSSPAPWSSRPTSLAWSRHVQPRPRPLVRPRRVRRHDGVLGLAHGPPPRPLGDGPVGFVALCPSGVVGTVAEYAVWIATQRYAETDRRDQHQPSAGLPRSVLALALQGAGPGPLTSDKAEVLALLGDGHTPAEITVAPAVPPRPSTRSWTRSRRSSPFQTGSVWHAPPSSGGQGSATDPPERRGGDPRRVRSRTARRDSPSASQGRALRLATTTLAVDHPAHALLAEEVRPALVIFVRAEKLGDGCLDRPPRLAEDLELPAELSVAEREPQRLRHARVAERLDQRGGVGERDGRPVVWGGGRGAERALEKNPAVFPAVPKLEPPLLGWKCRKGAVCCGDAGSTERGGQRSGRIRKSPSVGREGRLWIESGSEA